MNYSEQDILGLENKRYSWLISQNFDSLENSLSDQLVYIHSSGVIDNKTSYLNLLKSGNVLYKRMECFDTNVRIFENIGIITGTAHFDVVVNSSIDNINLKFHSVWIFLGEPKFLSWQATR